MSSGTDSVTSRVNISLPDMFKGFLVDNPVVNPHYEAVRAETDQWLKSCLSLSAEETTTVHLCDFAYFAAVLMPDAPREKLRTASDWGSWLFLFDDMFDKGKLRANTKASHRMILHLLAIMAPGAKRSTTAPIVAAHDDIYKRVDTGSTPTVRKRYIDAMEAYCSGTLQHVADFAADRTPTLSEMLTTRVKSGAIFPSYALFEFGNNLNIPDEVFLHPAIKELEVLGAELVVLMNDVLSYRKEEREGCPFNVVAVCRINGASAQEAFNEIGSMIDARFDMWNKAVGALPSWGAEVDAQVDVYVSGLRNIVQANSSWSFHTGRYFGQEAEAIRCSREISVLTHPQFLPVKQ